MPAAKRTEMGIVMDTAALMADALKHTAAEINQNTNISIIRQYLLPQHLKFLDNHHCNLPLEP